MRVQVVAHKKWTAQRGAGVQGQLLHLRTFRYRDHYPGISDSNVFVTKSTDGAHPGTAVLKFGPVKLDVLIKKQVEHALTSGSAVMNADLVQKD